ncbi:MAG: S-layer homology domain-containing protein [Candidatus Margulisiibacteriota bacterium]
MKNKIYFIILMIALQATVASAVPRNALIDVTALAMGSRSMGMGQAYAALDTPAEAIFTNPAALAAADAPQFSSSLFNLAGDFSYKILTGVVPFDLLKIGFGLASNYSAGFDATEYLDGRVRSTGSFSGGDTVLAIGAGRNFYFFGQNFGLGLTGKYYTQNIAGNQRGALGLDAGLRTVHINNKDLTWSSGIVLKNVLPFSFAQDSYYGNSELINMNQPFGTAVYFKPQKLLCLTDIKVSGFDIGLEYELDSGLFLRAGSNSGKMSLGLGLKLEGIPGFEGRNHVLQFDLAYQALPAPFDEEANYFFSISYLGPTKGLIQVRDEEVMAIMPPDMLVKPEENGEQENSLIIDMPKDKMVTDLDMIWVKGRAGKDLKRVFVNSKEAVLEGAERRFQMAWPLETFGKVKITIEGLDNKDSITAVSQRIYKRAAFADVRGSDELSEAILRMAELGFISGYSDKGFHAEKPLSRAELAAVLAKIKSLSLDKATAAIFPDVPADLWAASYIDAVSKAGIMPPFKDGSFKPMANISHAEAVVILSRFAELTPPAKVTMRSFNDLPLDNPVAAYAEIVKKAGILKGINTLKPNAPLTRGDAALWLYRTGAVKKYLQDIDDWDKGF